MDKALREAERSGDAVRLLRERLRAGELTQKRLELAASLGHAAARELCPEVESVNWLSVHWAEFRGRQPAKTRRMAGELVSTAHDLLRDRTLPVRVASDWAEHVFHHFEAARPEDDRPRKAIDRARAWVAGSTADARHGIAVEAAAAASAAADAGFDVHDAPPGAISPNGAAANAAFAAQAVAAAAAYADNDAHDAMDAACHAAHLVAEHADPDEPVAREAEREWQRLRLAAYVLGEVDTAV